jgi:hypothetical protein
MVFQVEGFRCGVELRVVGSAPGPDGFVGDIPVFEGGNLSTEGGLDIGGHLLVLPGDLVDVRQLHQLGQGSVCVHACCSATTEQQRITHRCCGE